MTTYEHRPVPYFWEAGSDECPHGPAPDRDSDAWDDWAERHPGSPEEIFICLDAPIGECCDACSEETGEPVGWEWCEEREANRAP